MIKAVFFDIDGTLLGYKSHNLLPGTVEAFSILKERGVKTFISSGRPMVLIPKLPLHFDGYITVNGGYCIVGDQVILRNTINPDDADRWLQYVRENNLTTIESDVAFNNQRLLQVEDQLTRASSSMDSAKQALYEPSECNCRLRSRADPADPWPHRFALHGRHCKPRNRLFPRRADGARSALPVA